ncbi:MAG: malectin domain-containing carbohydrate-binding protein [Leeuwenhoekiella sp.]
MHSIKKTLVLFVLVTLFKTYSQTPGTSFCDSVEPSSAITLSGVNNKTISQVEIKDVNGAAIFLNNCHNITIEKSIIANATGVGIKLLNCSNIIIRNNRISKMASGVYAVSSKGIKVIHNSFQNANGPYPRGQMVQFDKVNGGGNEVSHNSMENILGESYPEDVINLYMSNGTVSNPILIHNNWIRGGGPSRSGGGIMTGDMGGSNVVVSENVLVDPGQYGIAAASGTNIKILNNKVYGKAQYFTNVGIYAWNQYPYPMDNITISGNQINYKNSSNGQNPLWISANAGRVHGRGTNDKYANFNASLLPEVIFKTCDGTTYVDREDPDSDEPCTELVWYADKDKDGLGDPKQSISACTKPAGYVNKAGDLCPENGDKITPDACGCDTTSSTSGTAVARINAGGGRTTYKGNEFNGDTYSSGGATARTSSAIRGTTDSSIYQSERYSSADKGSFTYDIPVNNGTYDIVLHFAEIYWSVPGQRIFNVFAEGNLIVHNYDIVAAVGKRTADRKTYTVEVTDGKLNLKFTSLVNRAKIAALEIYTASDADCDSSCTEVTWYADKDGDGLGEINTSKKSCDRPTGYVAKFGDLCPDNPNKTAPNACGCDTESSATGYMFVNAGGGKLNFSGTTFNSDQYSTGGKKASTSAPIANTIDDKLFQSERYSSANLGSFGYDIPVENNTYEVTLHFAEIYWSHSGQRVFSVAIEGNTVIANLDLVAQVGSKTAYSRTFIVDVADGKLDLHLAASRNRPTLSGIEIAVQSETGRGCSSSKAYSSASIAPKKANENILTDGVDNLEIYPTLIESTFTIDAPETGKMSIMDTSGRRVQWEKIQTGQNIINISALPKGVYILDLLLDSGKVKRQKILKTR